MLTHLNQAFRPTPSHPPDLTPAPPNANDTADGPAPAREPAPEAGPVQDPQALARSILPAAHRFLTHLADGLDPQGDVAQGLRPATPADRDGRERLARVGRSALASAIAQGGCFGTAFALSNYARAAGNPVVKIAAAHLPLVAALATGWAEQAVRGALRAPATRPPQSSLAFDAIASGALMAVNGSYLLSGTLPRYAPTTVAGVCVTVGLSMLATGLAGASAEATAQHLRDRDPHAPPTGAAPEPARTGTGRMLSLVAAIEVGKFMSAQACHPRATPWRFMPLANSCAIAICWGGRQLLMPGPQAGHATPPVAEPSPIPARAAPTPARLASAAPQEPADLVDA